MMGVAEWKILLALLEAKSLQYVRSAIADCHGPPGVTLIESNLLSPIGFESVVGNEDDLPIGVGMVGDELGYFDPDQGRVSTAKSALTLFKPDLALILERLLGDNLRMPFGGPVALYDDIVWEIGSAYLTKAKPASVWFARRLNDPFALQGLVEAATRRPAPSMRLVLTTTASKALPEIVIPHTKVVPIADVVTADDPGMIDFSILKKRFAGDASEISGPIHLSSDGRVLTINGTIEIEFSGDIQIEVIRRLVDAHRRGSRVKAARLLRSANSSARQFSQVFKTQWPALKEFLKSSNGLWDFEV